MWQAFLIFYQSPPVARYCYLVHPPHSLKKKRNTPKGEKCAINNWVQVSSAELIIYSILYSTLALHFQR